MRKAHELFPPGHPLIRKAVHMARSGDGSHHDTIAAAMFVATRDAEERHRRFVDELRRRLRNGWPGDLRQPVVWALDVLAKLEAESE